LLRSIVERAPVGLLVVDRVGAISYAASVGDEFGYSPAGLVGRRLVEFVHSADHDRLSNALLLVARGERPSATIEVRFRRGDGGYVGVEALLRSMGDSDDELAGAVVLGLRVLSRPWAGMGEMVAATHRQRVLADASDCGVAIVSGEQGTRGAVLDANAPFGRIMGATTGQLVGSRLSSLVAEADGVRLQEALDAIAEGGDQRVLEVRLSHRLAAERLAEVTIKPESADARRRELIVRVRDITDQLRLVSELSRAVDQLEQSNRELAEFARITAHDLSAPLLAVSRLIDLISAGGADPEFPATLDAIRSAIGRMQAMVDGVMGYTESLEAAPTRSPINLQDILARVLDSLAAQIADAGAVITHGELPTVHGDEHQLERVLQNLISNAIKFGADAPPRIHIDSQRLPNAWQITVSDEGIGIPETDQTRIFELFARGQGGQTGRGIGLATVRRIIELHGGHIWAAPNHPQGTTFTFTLPTEPTLATP
jgi:PAS domain S-box-containing protein